MTTYADIERMATAIAKSELFPGLRRVEQAITLCLLADADGFHPVAGARDYHIIQGRPALKVDAMLTRFQIAGGRVEWTEYTDRRVAARFSHPAGGSVDVDWTLERAAAAGLKSDAWKKYPRALLRARVCSEGIRTIYPGILQGLYTPEEVAEFGHDTPVPPATSAQVDPVAVSAQHLVTLREQVANILDIEALNAYWRDNKPLRLIMTTADLNTLTSIFREQKSKILAAKENGSENEASANRPQAGIETPAGRPEGRQNPSPGATAGAPTAPVGTPPDQEDEAATEEAVAELFSYALEVGIAPPRLAAYISAATNNITDDLRTVSNRVLAVVRKQVDKVAAKKGKPGPATIEGDIIPEGYVIQPEELALFHKNALEDV